MPFDSDDVGILPSFVLVGGTMVKWPTFLHFARRSLRCFDAIGGVVGLLALVVLALAISPPNASWAANGMAVVYKGPGACEGCPEAAGAVAKRLGLEVRYVSGSEITEALLADASVYIQGGGDDALDIRRSLTDAQVKLLRRYVADGGRYWGICAGAYFAGATIDDIGKVEGLKLFDGDTEPYSGYSARVEKVRWGDVWRWMYLQDAPRFVLRRDADAEISATYRDGAPAALIARYGRGWISLSGPHPEATKEWLQDDGLRDPGLADHKIADRMLRDLLNKSN